MRASLAGARNGLDHFNACNSRAGPRRVHGAITRVGDSQNTAGPTRPPRKKPYPGCRLRKARTADGRRVMDHIGILRAPALVSRARGASQPSVAAERFLMITLPGCLWCKRPFRARRGGSPKRFCCAAHRIAFWSAARRWAERAVVDADRCQFADCLRHLADHVLQQLLGHAIREGHIELAGDERQYRRRQVADDRIFDAVEIRSALLPIIGVSGHLDVLVRLEPDEFKRARADRMLAHVSRRDMTGIDRGIPGSEQSEKGWLRPLQAEGNLIVAMRGDRVE